MKYLQHRLVQVLILARELCFFNELETLGCWFNSLVCRFGGEVAREYD